MSAKLLPVTPNALPISQALKQCAPLLRLRERMADSNARYTAIRPLLPGLLADHVKAGPIDDEGWSLLAENVSVAAKLRQLQPRLEDALRALGWPAPNVRIKVHTDR